MLNTLKLLNRKWFVKTQEILNLKQGQTVYYLKCRVILFDESELIIEEKMSDDVLDLDMPKFGLLLIIRALLIRKRYEDLDCL